MAERQLDAAIENDLPAPATPQPLPLLLLSAEASPPSPPEPLLQERSPAPSVGSVSASPSPPGSPKVVCSQFRQAQYDEEMAAAEDCNAQQQLPSEITVEETETEWRRRDELARQAPDKNTALFVIAHDGQLHVRKDHRNRQGQAPLCYVDTGYRGAHAPDGQAHQGYMVYNKKDLQWVHRLKFHLRRLQA